MAARTKRTVSQAADAAEMVIAPTEITLSVANDDAIAPTMTTPSEMLALLYVLDAGASSAPRATRWVRRRRGWGRRRRRVRSVQPMALVEQPIDDSAATA